MIVIYACIWIGLGGSLNLAAILEFIDSDRDLIVAADENASDLIRNIGIECGVLFDEASPASFLCLFKYIKLLKVTISVCYLIYIMS